MSQIEYHNPKGPAMRRITKIIVHCAAVPPHWRAGESVAAKRDEINRWHNARGWNGIGYHFVIDRDGSTATGRPVSQQGAHARGHNANSIGICLIGGRGSREADDFARHYTPEQSRALWQLIERLRAEHPTINDVIGHNEVAAKACPGFDVQEWMEGLRAPVSQPDPSEQPGGVLAALVAALTRIMGGRA